MLKFTSFSAMSNGGLDRKVNRFLEENQDIEIVDLQFTASFGSIYVGIYYRLWGVWFEFYNYILLYRFTPYLHVLYDESTIP